jgi:hypothetical protein
LKIEPELRARAKKVSEAQRSIAGNGAPAVQDLCDSVGRHAKTARQGGRAGAKSFKLFRQVLARMNHSDTHFHS